MMCTKYIEGYFFSAARHWYMRLHDYDKFDEQSYRAIPHKLNPIGNAGEYLYSSNVLVKCVVCVTQNAVGYDRHRKSVIR